MVFWVRTWRHGLDFCLGSAVLFLQRFGLFCSFFLRWSVFFSCSAVAAFFWVSLLVLLSVLQVWITGFCWWMGCFLRAFSVAVAPVGFDGGGFMFDGAHSFSSSGDHGAFCLILLLFAPLDWSCLLGTKWIRLLLWILVHVFVGLLIRCCLLCCFCLVLLCFVCSELCWWLQTWPWFETR